MTKQHVTDVVLDADVRALADACRGFDLTTYPGGWPGEIEAALIDAVLSIRARYGGPSTDVRRAISGYRTHEHRRPLNDLAILAAWSPVDLQATLGVAQRTAGVAKPAAIIAAAAELSAIGVRHAADLEPEDTERRAAQKRAYVSVRGLGPVTWDYFGMNLGIPGVKADRWIIRFASRVLGRSLTHAGTRALVLEVAAALGVDPIPLDHAIWKHERATVQAATKA